MDNFFKYLKNSFQNLYFNSENNLYSIKELNEIWEKDKKIKKARKYREYISELKIEILDTYPSEKYGTYPATKDCVLMEVNFYGRIKSSF